MITNVLLYVLVILAEFRCEATTKRHRTNENDLVDKSKEGRNRDELSRIIKVLNGDTGFDSYYERIKNQGTRNHLKEYKEEMVLQKKHQKRYDTKNSESGVRLHLIKNPDVLDRYVKTLRRRVSDSSCSSSLNCESDDDRRYGNDAKDIRRNAMFRVQEASNEDKADPIHKEDKDKNNNDENLNVLPPSIEDQVTPFKTHFVTTEEIKDLNKKDSSLVLDEVTINTKRFKIKSKRNQIKEKTTTESWDTYDWKKHEDDDNKSKEKANDLTDKPDKIKDDKIKSEEKSKNDSWEISSKKVEEKVQSKEKLNNESWDKPSKRKEDKVQNEEESNSDLRDKPSKKKPKEDTFESEEKLKEDQWDNPGKKKPKDNDQYDDDAPKEDKNNKLDWDYKEKNVKKKKYWEEPEETTKQNRKKDFKDSKTYKDLWDSRDIDWKKKKSDSLEDDRPKRKTTKKWVEPKVKKKVDWDAPKKKKDINDNNWDKVGRDWSGKKRESREYTEKTSRSSWRQKKKNQKEVYEKPSYVARIPEYHNKYKYREGGGGAFRGRTPIPFVGKRGIYDDK